MQIRDGDPTLFTHSQLPTTCHENLWRWVGTLVPVDPNRTGKRYYIQETNLAKFTSLYAFLTQFQTNMANPRGRNASCNMLGKARDRQLHRVGPLQQRNPEKNAPLPPIDRGYSREAQDKTECV
jgi:hypothetical protein